MTDQEQQWREEFETKFHPRVYTVGRGLMVEGYLAAKRQDAETIAQLRARVVELEGITPEIGPRPHHSNGPEYQIPDIQRYGVRWNGPALPLAVPMADGYWVPFHLVYSRIAELEAKIKAMESAEPVAWASSLDLAHLAELTKLYGEGYSVNLTAAESTAGRLDTPLYLKPQPAPVVPDGFDRDSLEDVRDGLLGEPQSLDVGEGHVESTAGYCVRLINAILAAAPSPEPKS